MAINGDYEVKKATAAAALAEIDPYQPFGTDLYEAIARVSISVAVELVALRRTGEGVQVLLMRREPNEAYAGMWHSPGSVFRPGEDLAQAVNRLVQREFKAPVRIKGFAGVDNNRHEERGHFIHLIFSVDVGEGHDGEWFSVDHLPEPIVAHHKEVVIPLAVAAFLPGHVPEFTEWNP